MAGWLSEENEMARELSKVDKEVLGLPRLAKPKGIGASTLSYPILTEDVGYPSAPAAGSGSTSGTNGSKRSSLGPTVNKALQEVLGWKIKSDDGTGFLGALNQSFELKMVEGSVVSTWTPRSYVVQTDLSGGVTGAQASIFTMAKTLSDQLLPLVNGLYALDPASDSEAVDALKELVRSQVTNLTNEFGYLGGPRVMRVQQYLEMLFGITLNLAPNADPITVSIQGENPPAGSPLLKHFTNAVRPKPADDPFEGTNDKVRWPPEYWRNPDTVLGSLGDLRDELGLSEKIKPTYINTIEDEQNVTNFRIVIDYANSLLNGWQNSVQFFAGRNSHFLGTQLVIISRQLGVVSETVDEVRFVLDSVFIGPAQRETLQIDFASTKVAQLSPIHLEDMLQWMQDFVGAEAQNVIQTGGKLGLGEDFIAMIKQLYYQAYGLYQFSQGSIAPAMSTARVQQSLYKLALQLEDLYKMAKPVSVAYIRRRQ
jgi:hypothetical protein